MEEKGGLWWTCFGSLVETHGGGVLAWRWGCCGGLEEVHGEGVLAWRWGSCGDTLKERTRTCWVALD